MTGEVFQIESLRGQRSLTNGDNIACNLGAIYSLNVNYHQAFRQRVKAEIVIYFSILYLYITLSVNISILVVYLFH